MVMPLTGLLLVCVQLCAQQTFNRSLTAANGQFIGFMEFRPADYNSTEKRPAIIFLHGYGEKGNGTTDLHKINCCGLPSYIRKGHNMQFTWNGKTEGFVVLMPQLSTRYNTWESFYVDELIDYAKENLNVDANRIFVTGLSLGGGGTWAYASEAQSKAEKLAGIVPVVAPCMMTNGCNIAKAKLPVLAVHSQDDRKASPECTTNAIREISSCNATSIPNLIMYPSGGHAVWLLRAYSTDHTYQQPNIYEWMLAQNKSLHPNKKPKANAGADITVSGSSTVSLDGAASTDPDGQILRYIWRRITGTGNDTLINPMQAKATAGGLTTAGLYIYELKVVDDRAEWNVDTVNVFVTGDVSGENQTPFAYAGPDATLFLPAQEITLDGSLSVDLDGSIVKYFWEPISGPDTSYIDNPREAITKARQFIAGVYRYRLTVTDDKGKRASDAVAIEVKSPDENIAPVSFAGADTTITTEGGDVVLNGSGSYDVDGNITSYAWKKISGDDATIQHPDDAVTKIVLSKGGVYQFELEVTDELNAAGRDTVEVSWNASGKSTLLVVYPNPSGSSARLQVNNEDRGEVKVSVFDLNGRKVIEQVFTKATERLVAELPVSALQTGMFMVQVQSASGTESVKLVRRR